jgi:hypothetical protein
MQPWYTRRPTRTSASLHLAPEGRKKRKNSKQETANTHIRRIRDISQDNRVALADGHGDDLARDELRAVKVLLDGDAKMGVERQRLWVRANLKKKKK